MPSTFVPKADTREPRRGWAPGDYLCSCYGAGCAEKPKQRRMFVGAKRSMMCADCAYALPEPVPEDRIGRHVDVIISDNPDKWDQAFSRPQLLGWFVGQAMKRLNGAADPEEVYCKVCEKYGTRP